MVATDLNELPTDYLKCRAFSHAWEDFVPVGKPKPSFGFRVSILCVRCGAERHDVLDTNGAVQHRKYEYPDGYSLEYRVTRADARIVYRRRRNRPRIAKRGELQLVLSGSEA